MRESACRSYSNPCCKHNLQIQRMKQGKDLSSMLHYIQKIPEQNSAFSSSSKIEELILPLLAKNAEIRLVLKVDMPYYSWRSCLNINNLLRVMFPSSEISSKCQTSKIKCAYTINYGIASYFKKDFV